MSERATLLDLHRAVALVRLDDLFSSEDPGEGKTDLIAGRRAVWTRK